jgi:hypothetical protein
VQETVPPSQKAEAHPDSLVSEVRTHGGAAKIYFRPCHVNPQLTVFPVLNEKVVVDEGGTKVQAAKIVIPDVRCLALCLSKFDEVSLSWSHKIATSTLEKICTRQKWNYVNEVFEIDVPDLYNIAKSFPKEEQELVMDFWATFHAIVRHFMKKVEPIPYLFKKTGKRGGLRYKGWAWYTQEEESK